MAGHGKSAQEYTFDRVFGANTAQTAVFDAIGKDMTSACLEGFNTTIFAYGQTGAGKTYTVVGGEDGDTEGLIPRVLRDLFAMIARLCDEQRPVNVDGTADTISFHCKASIWQSTKSKYATHRHFSDEKCQPPGPRMSLSRSLCRWPHNALYCTAEEAIALLRTGLENRQVAATAMNETSSRSHSLFTLHVESKSTVVG